MKQLVVGLVATFAIGGAFAQQTPDALVTAKGGEVQVQATGNVQIGTTNVPSGSSAGAKVGDVITVTDGSARITYANGCSVSISPGVPHTIGAAPETCPTPSKRASDMTTKYALGAGAVVAAGVAAVGSGGDDEPSSK
jgi:hypothetical protein